MVPMELIPMPTRCAMTDAVRTWNLRNSSSVPAAACKSKQYDMMWRRHGTKGNIPMPTSQYHDGRGTGWNQWNSPAAPGDASVQRLAAMEPKEFITASSQNA